MATTTTFLTRPAVWTAATFAIGLTIAASTHNHEAHAAHASSAPLTFSSFTTLTLESSEQVSHNVKRLRFALPTPTSTTTLPVISSLLTRHTPPNALIPIFRPYTPIISSSTATTTTTPSESGHITFLVKLYPSGRASGKMHSLTPGDTMSFKSLPEFAYTPNEFSSMTLIAGGSGITPIYQLTQAILRNAQDTTKVTLVYANNTPEDILLKGEFDGLKRDFPARFDVVYLVSGGEVRSGSSSGIGLRAGYVTKELLAEVMPEREGAGRVKVLVSGPPAMTATVAGGKGGFGWTQGAMGGILKELGYTKEQVYKF